MVMTIVLIIISLMYLGLGLLMQSEQKSEKRHERLPSKPFGAPVMILGWGILVAGGCVIIIFKWIIDSAWFNKMSRFIINVDSIILEEVLR